MVVFSQGFGCGLGCTGWQFIYSDAHLFIRHHSQDISLMETPRQTPKGSSCLSPSNPTTSTIRLDLKSDHITLLFRESELLCIHSVKCKLPSLSDKALQDWSFLALMLLQSSLSILYFTLWQHQSACSPRCHVPHDFPSLFPCSSRIFYHSLLN